MKSLRYLLPLFLFLIVSGFFLVSLDRDQELDSPLIGKTAPAFSLPHLHQPDRMLSPVDLKGQVWMLNVWASWCVACRQEHPLFMELAKQNVLPIYGLNYKDERPDAIRWLQQFGDPYATSISDLDGRVGIDYGVYGVPETYIIDKQGVIRHKVVGPVTADELQTVLLPLIKELQG